MKDNVIYFPYIDLPRSQWFNQVSLYWDTIYTFNTHKSPLKPYMNRLIENDLVKTINLPIGENYFKDPEEFLDIIDYFNSQIYNLNTSEWKKSITLFNKKFDDNELIAKGLIERGLAKTTFNGDYEVEANSAKLYMNYLADKIGQNKEFNAMPITDTKYEIEYFGTVYNKSDNIISETRYPILENILPAPSKHVNPKMLANFKDKYKDELFIFRKTIEKEIVKIASIENLEKRNYYTKDFIKEIQYDINELSKKMESHNFRNIIRSDWLAIGVLGISAIELAHSSIGALPLLLAAIPLLYHAKKFLDGHIKIDENLNKEVCAYAVFANRTFKNTKNFI